MTTNKPKRGEPGYISPMKGRKTMTPEKQAKLIAARRAVIQPLEVRFWSKVDKRGPTECWPWKAHIQTRGYGQFHTHMENDKPVRVPAHRVAWELENGREVPDGKVIDHICKNTACCNPTHLRPVTQAENCTVLARPTPFYRNQLATHCPHGHAYTPENTARVPDTRRPGRSSRMCLTCYPHQWRFAEVPRERPPGSRVKPTDPDYQQRNARGRSE
jgi:hypothetical protein